MVATKDKVVQVILDGIEAANQVLPREAQLRKSEDTVLMGEAGELDSLRLVNLIVAIEQRIEEEFGVTVNLAEDEAMSLKANPFATVATLTDYIAAVLERKQG
jgi:acyl carrier protein